MSPDTPHEFVDALEAGPVRGRGAGLNPGKRFEDARLHILEEHLDQRRGDNPAGTPESVPFW